MSIPVKQFTLAANSAEGIFTASGVSPAAYELIIQDSAGSILVVNSTTDTQGYNIYSGSSNESNQFRLRTDGSELYLYNASSLASTVWVIFAPVLAGPKSATFTF